MAELKTKPTDDSVVAFLESVEHKKRREDSFVVLDLMKEVTGEEPRMWGTSIVGFGDVHYKYASGREGDWFAVGFSPRKQSMTLYIMSGFDHYDELLSRLGKYKTGKACLYINKIEDIDADVLRQLVSESVEHVSKTDMSGD
ncbi:MAG: DUF1801 domain-containing protein [Caldilineales bacterium]|nr:DUF1801 domain-containing protein [Caldilineales bacterium]